MNHEIKSCERCSSQFECKPGNITQCQCFGIKLTIEQKAYIEQRYSDCLCKNCLKTLQNEVELFREKFIYRNRK
ncbi:MAG TPA: cysteine-rich CWC family protein [Chitinophagaceae bacterium]|nr:cysteine-rich CWC family protein [Chitinophagaceae bacterium]